MRFELRMTWREMACGGHGSANVVVRATCSVQAGVRKRKNANWKIGSGRVESARTGELQRVEAQQ